MDYRITTFYRFTPLSQEQIERSRAQLKQLGDQTESGGLLIIAPEGINGTMAGSHEGIGRIKHWLASELGAERFQDSSSETMPFKRFKVSVRDEIVQLKRPDVLPSDGRHVSPAEWDRLQAEEGLVVIDVRNTYETKVGSFKNAINPQTKTFAEFPAWARRSTVPKDAAVGICCTGGIRCEKAAVALAEAGYTNVRQLDGGILNYLAERPRQSFEGECFVFDNRVVVDQALKPSQKYHRCVSCGDAGWLTNTCDHCQTPFWRCDNCQASAAANWCSKRCRYEIGSAQ